MVIVIAHSPAQAGEEIGTSFKNLTRSPVIVTIKTAIDETTLLAEDGTIYELPSILIPETVSGLSEKALKKLGELADGKKCTLWQTRKQDQGRVNRMGHSLGELECGGDKKWLTGQLVSEGLAITWPTVGSLEMVPALFALEETARKNKTGLWADENFILTPQTIKSNLNSRRIIEGTIYNVALVKNNIFLNFESNWKEDFTIASPPELRREFAKKMINLQSLKGQKVRVRGWVREYNGPMIELETADQLEILTPAQNPEDKKPAEPIAGMHTIKHPSPPSVEKPTPPEVKTEGEKSADKKETDKEVKKDDSN